MEKKSSKIYFGWWTVLIGAIWSGLGQGFYGFGISVLFKPIASDLGLTRSAASIASGMGRLEGGAESLLTGWLADKFGPKWIVIIGVFIAALGLFLMNFINSLWSYILVWGVVVAFGVNLSFSIAQAKFITDWFIKKRGLALGARYVIVGILGVILLPVVTWLVKNQGWRATCMIWGGVLLCGVPLFWYFLKQKRPEYYGLLPDGAVVVPGSEKDMISQGVAYAAKSAGEVEFTYKQALKTKNYWILTLGYSAGPIVTGAITVHFIAFLTDMGIDTTLAGTMMSIMIVFQVIARFIGSFLCDRLNVKYWRFILATSLLFQAAGVTVILLNQSMSMVWVFLALFGIGTGGSILPRIMMEGRYFGRKSFGSIDGTANLIYAPLGFIAPIYAGWVYDADGNYTIAFVVLAILAFAGALLCCLAKQPKPPAAIAMVEKFV